MIDQPTGGAELAPPDVSTGVERPAEPPAPRPAATPLRPGQLTVSWQIMVAITWAAVFFAFAATWKASEEIGIGTWWLGPRAQPRPVLVQILPFVLALGVAFTAIFNMRRVALVSIAGSLAVGCIAVFDVTRSGGLAAIEFAIAAGALLVSLGALTGTYRRVADH